jgi:Zn-dependent metalloprotease
MDQYQKLKETKEGDYGGVHINSGIPNRAFYLIATNLGGHSWDQAGRIWYDTMLSKDARIHPMSSFKEFAEVTVDVALGLFGKDVRDVVRKGWTDVGVLK